MRILLVEDEENIRDTVKLNLELDGYEVVDTGNGRVALNLLKDQHFDLLLLDVMLPEVDGFTICEQFRLTDTETPVIFMTAKDTPPDRINGLKRGADDYIGKPFNLEELLLRIKKLLKRSYKTVSDEVEIFKFGGNEVNFKTYTASSHDGKSFQMTKKEAMLLKLLTERANEVVSRAQILQTVWGYDVYPSTRTIDNFILAFRKYFEKDATEPEFFISVRGIGYKFNYN